MKKYSTVEQVDAWTEVATQLGYTIRYDHFAGAGGGLCEFGGTRALFVDVSLSSVEQLELLSTTISADPFFSRTELPAAIADAIEPQPEVGHRKAA